MGIPFDKKQRPTSADFPTTPAERRLLQRLRQLKTGVYLAVLTVAGGGVAELVLFSEGGKRERIG